MLRTLPFSSWATAALTLVAASHTVASNEVKDLIWSVVERNRAIRLEGEKQLREIAKGRAKSVTGAQRATIL
jgi:hypothetical protein